MRTGLVPFLDIYFSIIWNCTFLKILMDFLGPRIMALMSPIDIAVVVIVIFIVPTPLVVYTLT